jgi:hypothetical protein
MCCTQQPRDAIISTAAVTQSRGFPRRFNTADGGSLTQGRACVSNVSSDMPIHDCHDHQRVTACCTSPSMPATADLLLAFAVDLALRHCAIFVATSGCPNTKLGTSQIMVHLPHLRSRYSALGIVPTGCMILGLNPGRDDRFFSSPNCPDRPSRTHPDTYSRGTGFFPRGKGAAAWNWPLTSIYCRG